MHESFFRDEARSSGKRVAKAVLRKAAPLVGDYYKEGDVVCWSTISRIVGIDGPETIWLVNAGVPVCAAINRLRPATGPEALAMAEAHRFAQALAGEQQGFVVR